MEKINSKEIEIKYYVYFYYDVNDILLYVGLSSDIYKRFLSHMNDKEWSSQIDSIGYREYPNESTMKFSENYYIGKLKPKYNIIGNGNGELFMDVNDPSQEIILDKDSFILKFSHTENNVLNKNIPRKRMTLKEKFINDGWEIIEKSCIDIFDENIMGLDLNKTVFSHDGSFFYLSGHDSLKNDGGVNTSIKSIKSYFTPNVQLNGDKAKHLFLHLTCYDNNNKAIWRHLTGKVDVKNNYVSKVEMYENLDYITFSGDKFILDFKIFKSTRANKR